MKRRAFQAQQAENGVLESHETSLGEGITCTLDTGGSQHLGNFADFSVHTGSDNDTSTTATGDGAGGIEHIDAVAERNILPLEGSLRMFADRERLASKQRLISREVQAVRESQISRYNITN